MDSAKAFKLLMSGKAPNEPPEWRMTLMDYNYACSMIDENDEWTMDRANILKCHLEVIAEDYAAAFFK